MIAGYENKRLKLKAPLRNLPTGSIVPVRCKDGVPVDIYWRNRLKDARTDGCVEFETKSKNSKPTKKKEVE